jgi:hypothetical protein
MVEPFTWFFRIREWKRGPFAVESMFCSGLTDWVRLSSSPEWLYEVIKTGSFVCISEAQPAARTRHVSSKTIRQGFFFITITSFLYLEVFNMEIQKTHKALTLLAYPACKVPAHAGYASSGTKGITASFICITTPCMTGLYFGSTIRDFATLGIYGGCHICSNRTLVHATIETVFTRICINSE